MTNQETPGAVMAATFRKFATQADPAVLDEVRDLAAREGKQLQALVDEALRDLLEKRKRGRPRPEVLTAFGESIAEYAALYEQLAK
jgi:hypothetical protein